MVRSLGGGFFLALAGYFAALAAVDTGNPYGPMGASRTRMVGFLAEPVFMIVFFTVSFVAQSTIPYIVQQKWVANAAAFFSPAHILPKQEFAQRGQGRRISHREKQACPFLVFFDASRFAWPKEQHIALGPLPAREAEHLFDLVIGTWDRKPANQKEFRKHSLEYAGGNPGTLLGLWP